jgi:hypothetical protein
MLRRKYAAAVAGEDDPEFDDPDPVRGFTSQYLNMWPLLSRLSGAGNPLTSPEAWNGLVRKAPEAAPAGVAVESHFGEGISVALAWRLANGSAVVSVLEATDMAEAARLVKISGFRGSASVGKSLSSDPAWSGMKVEPQAGNPISAVGEFTRLTAEGALFHTGQERLTEQVLAARTAQGVNGPRMKSTNPTDAIKAAVWAAQTARVRKPAGKLTLLLPTE